MHILDVSAHSWIIKTFEDIREYAHLNGLIAIEGSADIAKYVAVIELSSLNADDLPGIPGHLTSFERYNGFYDDIGTNHREANYSATGNPEQGQDAATKQESVA